MTLMTKLNESVTDPNLPKLGWFRVYPLEGTSSSQVCRVNVSNLDGKRVEFVGAGSLCDSEGNNVAPYNIVGSSNVPIYFKSSGGFIQIDGKYIVSFLSVSGTSYSRVNIDDFAFSNLCTMLSSNYGGSYGDIKSLNGLSDNAVVLIYGAGVTGDLSSIATKKFSRLEFRYLSGINGDLADVPADVAAALTQSLELLGCTNLTVTAAQLGKYVNATDITMTTNGVTYSDVADALFANGKVSGSVRIRDSSTTKTCTFTSSGWTAA